MGKLTVLGTGTSDGVPMIGCSCSVCNSTDPRDKRLRTSALLETGSITAVIDTGIDFRSQALRHNINRLDEVLFTHSHADHVEGIIELRPLTLAKKHTVICRGSLTCINEIKKRFYYMLDGRQTGGGIPRIDLREITGNFKLGDYLVTPLPVFHGELPIFGFRIGDLAYITDASFIPEATFKLLAGVKTLFINGLRPKPHPTHFSYQQAALAAQRIGADTTRLIHMAHHCSHRELEELLPANVSPAYDGLSVNFSA